jgi:glycosyltransferase involved in cell wall biosynthesis
MNIVLLNYYDFSSNSAIHIFYLANALCSAGHDCVVLVPDRKDTIDIIGDPYFRYMTFDEVYHVGLGFHDGRDPDIVHAWTPREIARRMTEWLVTQYHCPYLVHLEDNEERITSDAFGQPFSHLTRQSLADLDGATGSLISHPIRYRDFLNGAAGVSFIIDSLAEFVPPGLPMAEILPAFAPGFLDLPPAPHALRASLGIADHDYVIVYPGAIHASNRHEVMSLFLAVGFMNRMNIPVRLVRMGRESSDALLLPGLEEIRPFVVDLGFLPSHDDVIRHMAIADVLVQPGKDNDFNAYRIPAKLPEFFATGRPVVLPDSNIGRRLQDREQGVLLREGNSLELVRVLEWLLPDTEARQRIGRAGRDFAVENFNWARSADHLVTLYEKARDYWRKARSPRPTSGPTGHPLRSQLAVRYRGDRQPPVSYATVADFCDSVEHLRKIATHNGDLKDAQRPWMLKAILAHVAPGGRLLEIGAGEPFVADLLSSLGYDVWVVDPYDGFGNGPTEFELFKSRYPKLRFLRQYFSGADDQLPKHGFDCIYSISVLEHVPDDLIPGVFNGIRACLRRDGWTIHAIDHVLRGDGAASHLDKLQVVAARCGVSPEDLNYELAAAAADTETYYLSAEGHNRWRGSTPYSDFPMRVCISVQLCAPLAAMAGPLVDPSKRCRVGRLVGAET